MRNCGDLGRRRFNLQPRNNFFDLASLKIDANLADPLIGLYRAFPKAQAGELPGMLALRSQPDLYLSPDK